MNNPKIVKAKKLIDKVLVLDTEIINGFEYLAYSVPLSDMGEELCIVKEHPHPGGITCSCGGYQGPVTENRCEHIFAANIFQRIKDQEELYPKNGHA